MEETLGKIFYLEKMRRKRFSIIKKYVVIRTLPDNYFQIEKEIEKKLNKGKWLPEKEIGLVFKEFN